MTVLADPVTLGVIMLRSIKDSDAAFNSVLVQENGVVDTRATIARLEYFAITLAQLEREKNKSPFKNFALETQALRAAVLLIKVAYEGLSAEDAASYLGTDAYRADLEEAEQLYKKETPVQGIKGALADITAYLSKRKAD